MQRNEEEVRGLRKMGTIDWIYSVRQGSALHGHVAWEPAEDMILT